MIPQLWLTAKQENELHTAPVTLIMSQVVFFLLFFFHEVLTWMDLR